MKRWIILILVFAFIVAMVTSGKQCSAVKGLEDSYKVRQACKRVTGILRGITEDESDRNSKGNETAAVGLFWNGKAMPGDWGDLSKASDAFDRWRSRGGIFPYIKRFKITGAKLINEKDPVIVIVAVTIDNMDFFIRAAEGETIEWANASDWPENEDDAEE